MKVLALLRWSKSAKANIALGLASLLACTASTAFAAPATIEEAQRLTALLERYIGHASGQRGAVSVVPHGDGYTASLDISQMFAAAAAQGVSITAGAVTAELTPQANGTWHVVMDGFPPIGVAHDQMASSVVLNGYTFDGVFDPAIQAFASASTTSGGSTTHATSKQGVSDMKLTDTGKSTTQAMDAGAGTINTMSASSLTDVTYAITVPSAPADADQEPAPAPRPPTTTTVTLAGLSSALSTAHAPVVAIEDLWQFLVAHHTKPELIAAQDTLKAKLRAVIPLSTATTLDLKLSKLAVSTSLGDFGLDSFVEHYDDNGPDAKGGVFTRIAMSGLKLPDGLVPPWGAPVLPTSIDIGQAYGPVDVKAGLMMAIDDFDLAADKPLTDEQQAAILAAFGNDGKTLTFAPSTIALPTMTIKFTGQTHMTKPLPTGTASVSAIGLDKTIAAVRAAAPDDPTATQIVTVLIAAKALAKAEGPDSYSWQIVGAPGGAVTVNGTLLSSLMQGGGAQSGGMQGAPPPRKKHNMNP